MFVSACMSDCMYANLNSCLPACLPVCLSACLPACLPACLSVCLSVCLSACTVVCSMLSAEWSRPQCKDTNKSKKELVNHSGLTADENCIFVDIIGNDRGPRCQTPSTGLRLPSFGGRCRKAMLGVCQDACM